MIKLIDILQEIHSYKTPTTKLTSKDPIHQVFSWDVSYEPDFVKLIDETGHLIREYNAIIVKNKLENDLTLARNLQELKDFRTNLTYLAQAKYPELKDKIKNIQEIQTFSPIRAKNNQELLKILNGPQHNQILDYLLDTYTKWTEDENGESLRRNFHNRNWEYFIDRSKKYNILEIDDMQDNRIFLSFIKPIPQKPEWDFFKKINFRGKELYIDFA